MKQLKCNPKGSASIQRDQCKEHVMAVKLKYYSILGFLWQLLTELLRHNTRSKQHTGVQTDMVVGTTYSLGMKN